MQLGNCIGWAIDAHRHENTPLVVLVPPAEVAKARYATATTLPGGSVGSGRTWRTPQGRLVTVVSYLDAPFERGFKLVLCCGGSSMSVEDMQGIRKWREKCQEELRPWEL